MHRRYRNTRDGAADGFTLDVGEEMSQSYSLAIKNTYTSSKIEWRSRSKREYTQIHFLDAMRVFLKRSIRRVGPRDLAINDIFTQQFSNQFHVSLFLIAIPKHFMEEYSLLYIL